MRKLLLVAIAFVVLSAAPTEARAAPDTFIDSGPTGQTASTSATFTFHSSQGGSTFQCQLDGAGYTACSSPKSYSGLAVEPHTFNVRAAKKGQTDPTPATRSWEIVAPPPPPPPPPPPSGYPASFFTGPAGASNPLPAPGKAWFGTETLCYPFLSSCTYQDHIAETHQREAQVGRQFSVVHDFQQQTCSLDMSRVNAYRAEAPLVLSWEPNPNKPDQVLAGQADTCIRSVAAQLSTAATGSPVILRMYHEWNGTWMNWSSNTDGSRVTSTQARDVFRRTVDQLRAGGAFANGKVATMLDWAEGYFGNGDAFDELVAYPGDDYVDWISSTAYSTGLPEWCGPTTQHYCELPEVLHHGNCLTPPFPEQQQPGFACSASKVPNGTEVFARDRKPYLLSETGRDENALSLQGSWMRYAGAYISANMPGLYGVTYFDVDARAFGETANWVVETNAGKLQGFADWAALPRFN